MPNITAARTDTFNGLNARTQLDKPLSRQPRELPPFKPPAPKTVKQLALATVAPAIRQLLQNPKYWKKKIEAAIQMPKETTLSASLDNEIAIDNPFGLGTNVRTPLQVEGKGNTVHFIGDATFTATGVNGNTCTYSSSSAANTAASTASDMATAASTSTVTAKPLITATTEYKTVSFQWAPTAEGSPDTQVFENGILAQNCSNPLGNLGMQVFETQANSNLVIDRITAVNTAKNAAPGSIEQAVVFIDTCDNNGYATQAVIPNCEIEPPIPSTTTTTTSPKATQAPQPPTQETSTENPLSSTQKALFGVAGVAGVAALGLVTYALDQRYNDGQLRKWAKSIVPGGNTPNTRRDNTELTDVLINRDRGKSANYIRPVGQGTDGTQYLQISLQNSSGEAYDQENDENNTMKIPTSLLQGHKQWSSPQKALIAFNKLSSDDQDELAVLIATYNSNTTSSLANPTDVSGQIKELLNK